MPNSTWKNFEIDCTKYLQQKFGAYATFKHLGEEDSTVPDIFVETMSGNSFYIDAKHSPAQCGQFVLLENTSTEEFEYSPRNINIINTSAIKIMQYMNSNFDIFSDVGTSGQNIAMPNASEVFSDWVIDTYSRKGARFFITNEYTILPINRFKEYFNITAKYRVKKSGSSAVGKTRLASVKNYIESHEYNVSDIRTDGDKLFVSAHQQLHNTKFRLENYQYMFSQRGDEFEIRKLSNTNNANVIFSIEKKYGTHGLTDQEFISALK